MSAPRKPPRLPQLDFRSGLPAYQQIIRQVQRYAAGGRFRIGDQLPTVRGLARQLGVNFNTVARAYRLLDRTGVVSTQRGRGTYVLGHAARGSHKETTLDSLASQFIAEARRHNFSAAQIEAVVARQLQPRLRAGRVGDKDG
jgi:GntR family transcriptional regulator